VTPNLGLLSSYLAPCRVLSSPETHIVAHLFGVWKTISAPLGLAAPAAALCPPGLRGYLLAVNDTRSAGSWSVTPLLLDTVVYPDWHPRFGEVGPVYVYLLRNDEQLVLVDTGIGPAHPLIDRLYSPARRDLRTALREDQGISPEDIDAVVLSHLHFDHVGGVFEFPGKPLYVQRAEWEAAQAEKYTVPEFLSFPDANFVLLDGDTELSSGLRLVLTAGHTPGHQAVAVSTVDDTGMSGGGLVVLAGQAIETSKELTDMKRSGDLSPAARQLLDLEPSRTWFSHDHRCWERPAVSEAQP
jgi:N-acyl homoserine lactone hydrolase